MARRRSIIIPIFLGIVTILAFIVWNLQPRITGEPAAIPLVHILDKSFPYHPEARGIPSPSWRLSVRDRREGPNQGDVLAGMQGVAIDERSGAITWSSDQIGLFEMTVKASNPFGTARQTFMIRVASPPAIRSVLPGEIPVLQTFEQTLKISGSKPISMKAEGATGLGVDDETLAFKWTAPQPGIYTILISASNEYGRDVYEWKVRVHEQKPKIVSTPLPLKSEQSPASPEKQAKVSPILP